MTTKQAYQILGVKGTESQLKIEAQYQNLLVTYQRNLMIGNDLKVRQQAQQQIVDIENAICCIRKSGKKSKQQTLFANSMPPAPQGSQTCQAPPISPVPPASPMPSLPPELQTAFGRWLYRLVVLLASNGRAAYIGAVIVLVVMGILIAACVKGCTLQKVTRLIAPATAIEKYQNNESVLKDGFEHSLYLQRISYGTYTVAC